MKVVRVYHAGRDAAHRERERALVRAGVEVTLVVPTLWPGADDVFDEPFQVVELPVKRAGDVNRHRYENPDDVLQVIRQRNPDVVDLHEEPFSAVVHQLLPRLDRYPAVAYAAQNIDKRFPSPFAQWERRALGQLRGLYPCSAQAASVAVGKGFRGAVRVLPLAPSPLIVPGHQAHVDGAVQLLLVGRLVPEKGVRDAVRVLAHVRERTPAELTIVGEGPQAAAARTLAEELGVSEHLRIAPWADAPTLADYYAAADVLLAPSSATRTWVEQFGRMIVEAHAAGVVPVAYASGSLPEVVGDAGILVPEGNVAALGAAVAGLAIDHEMRTALRLRGAALAATRTWDSVARGQRDLYAEVRDAPVPAAIGRPRRATAVDRFGPPAEIAGGGRPFALPILRDDTALSRTAARAIDRVTRRDAARVDGRLTVAYIDHVAQLSGGEIALARLIESLPDVDAHVILGEDGPLRPRLAAAGAHVKVLPLDPRTRDVRREQVGARRESIRAAISIAGYVIRLARLLHRLQPDLVHTNSLKSGYYGSLAARLVRVPVVWHLRDRIADDYLPRQAIGLTRLALRRLPDLVVCNSDETRRTAALPSVGVEVVASPVVHDPYPAGVNAPPERSAVRAIGIVGRLAPWKGQDVFLRAVALLAAEQPDLRARVIGSAMFGEDDYAASLVALAGELGIADRVTFVGFTDDVHGELAGLDVLVHASVTPEPFGQVVVEGMAAGLPVVATDAGGPAEIITDGVNGVLVPPAEPAALAAALRRLAADVELRARIATAGTARARDFAPEVIGEQMLRIYRHLLAER